jgi:DNA-directed RNA polymerase subunit K/omega
MSSFINFNNRGSVLENKYSAEVIKTALLKSETKSSAKAESLTKNIKEPVSLNEALVFFTDKLGAIKQLNQSIVEVNEGRVKQFEMDYASMVKDIKKGYGWIDPEYVAQTWDNSSDSIDFELVRDELFDRLIAAGLLAHADDNNPEKAGKKIKSAKELYVLESATISESATKQLADEEKFELYTATLKNKTATLKATTTTKTWDDGVPVLKYLARGSAKPTQVNINGSFEVAHDVARGWFYFTDGRKWFGLHIEDGYGDSDDLPFNMEVKESVVAEARFVKDFNRDVLKAKTKEEVLELYPNAEFFIGKSDHFFGELDDNLFFKAYYTKAQEEFEIKSVYSEKNSNYVHLYNESLVYENYEVIYSDGISAMKKFRSEAQAIDFMKKEIASNKKLRDIAVYKPGMHSTTQTELVVSFWGNGSYLDNVSKKDPKLAAKKLEESVVTEGRSVNKIQKEWNQVTTDMIQKVAAWKAAEGDRKAEILEELKALTAKKKALESELDVAVAGKDKDVQLVVSEGNAFGAARAEAIAKGEKTFKVDGEEHDVESADKEDKENAEEFVSERSAFLAARAKAIQEESDEFEFNGKTYPVIYEGNAFGAARAEAIANGASTFTVDGEEYDVEDVDAEDKKNSEEFVEESEILWDALIEKFTVTNEDLRSDIKKYIKTNKKEIDALADQDDWDRIYSMLMTDFEVEEDDDKAADELKTIFNIVY